jgi:hypothetical protein
MKNEDKDVHLLPSSADGWAVAERLLFFHFSYFRQFIAKWNLEF